MRSHRWSVVLIGVAATFASCSSRATPRSEESRSAATVTRSSFLIHRGSIGVGAKISVAGDETLRDIELTIDFFHGTERVRREHDTLPFCHAIQPCLWGMSFVMNDAGERLVDRVAITVQSDGGPYDDDAAIRSPTVARTDASLSLTTPDARGVLYLIAIEDGDPVFGTSVSQTRAEGSEIHFDGAQFPLEHEVVAVFYEGHVPGAGSPGAD